MNEKTKESKFLDAINKYAEHQKAQISQEIETYKNEKIEQATEQGLQDAYELIRADISRRKAAIVNQVAVEELRLRNELFAERQSICDKVFAQAKDQLTAFTQSAGYTAFLERSLHQIREVCGDHPCKVSVAPKDEDKRDMIQNALSGTEVIVDNAIAIGGVKAYCTELGILMDDTLDSRLEEQRAWFIENAGLKVV